MAGVEAVVGFGLVGAPGAEEALVASRLEGDGRGAEVGCCYAEDGLGGGFVVVVVGVSVDGLVDR